jgi:hypothetical protein
MNLLDIENANKANKILQRLNKQIENLEYLGKTAKKDYGGIEGEFEYGYFCFLSDHSDGSGSPINLTGCYVGIEVKHEILLILFKQKKKVLDYLDSIGVIC